jgi:hypothetical protein
MRRSSLTLKEGSMNSVHTESMDSIVARLFIVESDVKNNATDIEYLRHDLRQDLANNLKYADDRAVRLGDRADRAAAMAREAMNAAGAIIAFLLMMTAMVAVMVATARAKAKKKKKRESTKAAPLKTVSN